MGSDFKSVLVESVRDPLRPEARIECTEIGRDYVLTVRSGGRERTRGEVRFDVTVLDQSEIPGQGLRRLEDFAWRERLRRVSDRSLHGTGLLAREVEKLHADLFGPDPGSSLGRVKALYPDLRRETRHELPPDLAGAGCALVLENGNVLSCRIIDISRSGAKLRMEDASTQPPEAGCRFIFHRPDEDRLCFLAGSRAEVRWSQPDNGEFGLAFDAAVDGDSLDAALT